MRTPEPRRHHATYLTLRHLALARRSVQRRKSAKEVHEGESDEESTQIDCWLRTLRLRLPRGNRDSRLDAHDHSILRHRHRPARSIEDGCEFVADDTEGTHTTTTPPARRVNAPQPGRRRHVQRSRWSRPPAGGVSEEGKAEESSRLERVCKATRATHLAARARISWREGSGS